MSEQFERVYTVTGWWDGPRSGVADWGGVPHSFESLFDDLVDEWSDTFLVSPLNQETFLLALEDWEIWKRWKAAHNASDATLESHPALPEDRERSEQLRAELELRLQPGANSRKMTAVWRTIPGAQLDDDTPKLEVMWSQISD